MQNLNINNNRLENDSQLNIGYDNSNDGLIVQSSSGRFLSFDKLKRQSLKLSYLMGLAVPYNSVWFNMQHCGDFIVMGKDSSGNKKILNANFCHARLCPMCQQRRSAKARAQILKIVSSIENCKYLFLTLTLKNVLCSSMDISAVFETLASSWQRLSQRKPFRDVVKGYYKAIEFTVDLNMKITSDMYLKSKSYYDSRNLNIGDDNPNFFNIHPHLHVILCVDENYFNSPGRHYISHQK